MGVSQHPYLANGRVLVLAKKTKSLIGFQVIILEYSQVLYNNGRNLGYSPPDKINRQLPSRQQAKFRRWQPHTLTNTNPPP